VAEQPRLDVLLCQGLFEQRVVVEIDLADRQVIGFMSAGSALPGGGEGSSSCPNYTAPPLTIANGLAQFDVQHIRFQGYVTPGGALAMRTGVGQRFEGQIDAQNVLKGRVIGACVYDATWHKGA